MRFALLVSLFLAGVAFAGCAESDDEGRTHTCEDGTVLRAEDFPDHNETGFDLAAKCPGVVPTAPTVPTTPNELPTLVLTVVDDAGNGTNTTTVGGNLTFSAELSTDPDGTVEDVAARIVDANGTRVVTLRKEGKDTPQTLQFMHPGPVLVALAGIDDRVGITTMETYVFVNQVTVKDRAFQSFLPAQTVSAEDCAGPVRSGGAGSNPVDPQYYEAITFDVIANASYIEARVVSGGALLAICDPEGVAISGEGDAVTSTNEGPLPPPTSASAGYYIATFSTGTAAPAAPNEVQVEVIVHYEPRPAA